MPVSPSAPPPLVPQRPHSPSPCVQFPYSTGPRGVWSGYFTSRPSLKRYVRLSSQQLNVARHWELFAGGNGSSTERLWEALGHTARDTQRCSALPSQTMA